MHINLTDLALTFGPVFAYSLLLCWLFSKLFPKPLIIIAANSGMLISFTRMYFEPGRYWLDVTIGIVAVVAGAAVALWLLQRRLGKQSRPVRVSSCRCPGFSCRGGSWGSCDSGGF
jgi:hypothetical protein